MTKQPNKPTTDSQDELCNIIWQNMTEAISANINASGGVVDTSEATQERFDVIMDYITANYYPKSEAVPNSVIVGAKNKDLKKDIKFLSEMKGMVVNAKTDVICLDHLELMIDDWLFELKKTKGKS